MSGYAKTSTNLQSAIREAARADLSSIFRLAYVSKASAHFGPDDLLEIGRSSAERNSKADITGILIKDGDLIMQILEGDEGRVRELFSKISKDARHENVRLVAGAAQSSRLLSCWSLVSGRIGGAPAELMEEFSELHQRLGAREGLADITVEEVELLKVIALFRSVPL